jgi:hypothetical protein
MAALPGGSQDRLRNPRRNRYTVPENRDFRSSGFNRIGNAAPQRQVQAALKFLFFKGRKA